MSDFKLPAYFNEFPVFIPQDVIDAFIIVENAFNVINYNAHVDDISFIFYNHEYKTSKDLYDIVCNFYREHINSVLTLQGILLANPYTDPIIRLSKILQCVSILATTPLSLISEIDAYDGGTTVEEYFSKVISMISDLDQHEIMESILLVLADVVEYLRLDEPILPIITASERRSAERFKKSPIPKEGIIVDAIKSLNRFGYDVRTFIATHGEMIADLFDPHDTGIVLEKNIQLVADEIILLVLGSDTQEQELLSVMLSVAERMAENGVILLKLNALIMKYMETTYG